MRCRIAMIPLPGLRGDLIFVAKAKTVLDPLSRSHHMILYMTSHSHNLENISYSNTKTDQMEEKKTMKIAIFTELHESDESDDESEGTSEIDLLILRQSKIPIPPVPIVNSAFQNHITVDGHKMSNDGSANRKQYDWSWIAHIFMKMRVGNVLGAFHLHPSPSSP